MKKILLAFSLLLFTSSINAQTGFETSGVEILMKTDANHAYLKQYVGDWSVNAEMWMGDDSNTVQKIVLYGTVTSLLDNRFTKIHINGFIGKTVFETDFILGFNTLTEKAELSEMNNLTTEMNYYRGIWETVAEKLLLSSTATNPFDGSDIKIEKEFLFLDANNFTVSNFDYSTGERKLTIQFVFTRV